MPSIYYVKNIAGGTETYSDLTEAVKAAVTWGKDGYITSKRGSRLVSEEFSDEGEFLGYSLGEYE